MPTTAASSAPHARDRIFVALDFDDTDKARRLVQQLGDTITGYKIGLELVFSGGRDGGLDLARELVRAGKRLFLDLKLLDIPNTVEAATRNIAKLGVHYLTVHGTDTKTLEAAVRGARGSDLKLLAVTVLTSLDARDLAEQGLTGRAPEGVVVERAVRAEAAGFHGVIASGHEAAVVRAAVPPGFLIVTPGIRLEGDDPGDQSRIMTPAAAIRAGASHLVVGRSITKAADPLASAAACVDEVARLRG